MDRQKSLLFALILGTASSMAASAAKATPYDTVLGKLTGYVEANPTLVTTTVVGRNDQGLDIIGVIIKGPTATDGAPSHLVVGSHHGNERLSVDVALSFAEQAIATLKNPSSQYYEALADKVLHVIPVLNIGGYNNNRREEYDVRRVSIDPNRDYPDPCDGSGTKFRLASTEALARYVTDQAIVGAVTIHGYIGTFTFPWGTYTTETESPDHDTYMSLSRKVADINGYRIGTHADVIYPTNGAFEDWAYHSQGVWTTLLELRRNANVARDAEGLLAFFAAAPTARSAFHEHLGECRRFEGPIRARP